MDIHQFFEDHNDEFLKFDRVTDKTSQRPDIHAFRLLDRLVPGNSDMVSAAEHDEIYLDVDVDAVVAAATEAQLIELIRCGVRHDDEFESFCMFV